MLRYRNNINTIQVNYWMNNRNWPFNETIVHDDTCWSYLRAASSEVVQVYHLRCLLVYKMFDSDILTPANVPNEKKMD
ncbi:MAG: hypothetical protein FWJ66_04900 [Caldibacillus sp.]